MKFRAAYKKWLLGQDERRRVKLKMIGGVGEEIEAFVSRKAGNDSEWVELDEVSSWPLSSMLGLSSEALIALQQIVRIGN